MAPGPRSRPPSACDQLVLTSPPARAVAATWSGSIRPALVPRLLREDHREVWLLSWLPGQGTGFHDHGAVRGRVHRGPGRAQRERTAPGRAEAAGAMLVVTDCEVRSFGPRYVHDVGNDSAAPAVSVHAYSPPLTAMRRFDVTGGGWSAPQPRRPASGGGDRRVRRRGPGTGPLDRRAPRRTRAVAPAAGSPPARRARQSAVGRCWWTSARGAAGGGGPRAGGAARGAQRAGMEVRPRP